MRIQCTLSRWWLCGLELSFPRFRWHFCFYIFFPIWPLRFLLWILGYLVVPHLYQCHITPIILCWTGTKRAPVNFIQCPLWLMNTIHAFVAPLLVDRKLDPIAILPLSLCLRLIEPFKKSSDSSVVPVKLYFHGLWGLAFCLGLNW